MTMNERLRTLSMSLVGVSLGMLGTLLVAAIDPLSEAVRAATPLSEVSRDGVILETFHSDAPRDGMAAANGADTPIPAYPLGARVLSEEHVRQGSVFLTKLRDKQGTVIGFASEQTVIDPESNVMQGRLTTTTNWTLTIPERGTIFLEQHENQNEFARRAVLPALAVGKQWDEPWSFVTTVGPAPDGRGRVVGGTGEFKGITGTFVEVTHLRRFSMTEFVGTIELQLAYRNPPAPLAGR